MTTTRSPFSCNVTNLNIFHPVYMMSSLIMSKAVTEWCCMGVQEQSPDNRASELWAASPLQLWFRRRGCVSAKIHVIPLKHSLACRMCMCVCVCVCVCADLQCRPAEWAEWHFLNRCWAVLRWCQESAHCSSEDRSAPWDWQSGIVKVWNSDKKSHKLSAQAIRFCKSVKPISDRV